MLLDKTINLFIKYMQSIDRSKETIKSYSIELKLLSEHLSIKYNGPVYLEEVQLHDIEDYMQMLKLKKYSPSSRNHSLYILRSFYNYCIKKEYTNKNICAGIERIYAPQKERIHLTSDEVVTLIPGINSTIASIIIRALYYTGMRISECVNLNVDDIDLKNNIITVRNTKNKKDRQIPIHKDLQFLLADYFINRRKRKGSPYFFTTSNADRVSPDFINRVLRETTERLGWTKKVTCHTLRHSFASNLVAKNVNIVNIQKLLGHSNLSTTSIYTHTNLLELQNAIGSI